jgi:DNA repair photolyase
MKAKTAPSISLRTGTREWAGTNVNIQLGCENNCRYCYARHDAVDRFHKCTAKQWAEPAINQKKVNAKYPKYKDAPSKFPCQGRKLQTNRGLPSGQPVMFPSTHDITPGNLDSCLTVLQKLLEAGNQVLIVSKPHWGCVTAICDEFKRFREQIMWRFTIGSADDETLAFWEPSAPRFEERMSCLCYAYKSGYQTSISCEPLLDGFVDHIYSATAEFITDSFWIGLLRNFKQRVDLTGVSEEQMARFVRPLLAVSQPAIVKSIYELMKDKPYIRWKDSIRKIIQLPLSFISRNKTR